MPSPPPPRRPAKAHRRTPPLGSSPLARDLPVARIDGRWHLTVGTGRLPLADEALTQDLDTLTTLTVPSADPPERV